MTSAVWEFCRKLFLVAALAFVVLPIAWMLITSFKVPNEISTTNPVFVPSAPTLDNYRAALGIAIDERDLSITVASRGAGRSYVRSVVTAGVTTVLVVVLATPAGYALARIRVRGRSVVGQNVLFARVLPPATIALPLFAQFSAMRLIDTPAALIALYLGSTLPFAVWTLMAFIGELPIEVEEAAFVDGASVIQMLWRVVVPVLAPAVVAVAVITFALCFNEFFMALIFTRVHWLTFPVQTAAMIGTGGTPWGPMTAAGVIGLVPPLLTLLVGRRYLVQGLSLGAVK